MIWLNTLMVAVVAEAGLAAEIIDTGSKLGNLTAASVLGVVCVACVWAMVKLYKDKAKETESVKEVASKAVEAITKQNERATEQIKLLEEMHHDIQFCRKVNLEKEEEAKAKNKYATFKNPM